MGDVGEDFKALTEARKAKKKSNMHSSTKMLLDCGFLLEIKNGGTHLIVRVMSRTVDFWPSTGKWIDRAGRTSRGVKSLISHLKQEQNQ